MKKYVVELTADQCHLIVMHCIVFGTVASALKRMSNKPGTHKIKMAVEEINDIAGWLAAEANHCDDLEVEMELHQLWEEFESYLFEARRQKITSTDS